MTETESKYSFLMKKIGQGMMKGIDLVTGKDVQSIRKFVDRQRELHPDLSNSPDLLADRIIKKKNWYASKGLGSHRKRRLKSAEGRE